MSPTPSSTSSTAEAPPAVGYTSNDGFSPLTIIGIVIAIILLLLAVPLIAILLRRYERRRLQETPKASSSSSSGMSLRDGQNSFDGTEGEGLSLKSVKQGGHSQLGSILVTKELCRSSLRIESVVFVDGNGMQRPEEVYGNGRERERGWSCTEVRGGV